MNFRNDAQRKAVFANMGTMSASKAFFAKQKVDGLGRPIIRGGQFHPSVVGHDVPNMETSYYDDILESYLDPESKSFLRPSDVEDISEDIEEYYRNRLNKGFVGLGDNIKHGELPDDIITKELADIKYGSYDIINRDFDRFGYEEPPYDDSVERAEQRMEDPSMGRDPDAMRSEEDIRSEIEAEMDAEEGR